MNRRELLVRGGAAVAATAVGPGALLRAEDGEGALAGAAVAQAPAAAVFDGLHGRPETAQRRFTSEAVERTIRELGAACGDPELARIFGNCFPNTLDTTVFPGTRDGHPDTYVITGDIDAMWLRDSAAQVWPYLALAKDDRALQELLEGVVRRQARLILLDSYANAFTRNPNDPPLSWSLHDHTDMKPGIAERKYEIDSLCYPVRLAHGFWKQTGSTAPFDATWHDAAKRIVATFREQQRMHGQGPYHFQRSAFAPTDTLPMGGYGNPVKPNGLICSGFRPSDDACIYPFFIPANLFAAKTLGRIGEIATAVYRDAALASECEAFRTQVMAAIVAHGVVRHPKHGEMYAYEVDGYGNTVWMDDANAPGLLSLPYLELVDAGDARMRNTRAFALSLDNPYFFQGTAGEGIGGPHIGRDYIWPMSILMRALTSSDEAEITTALRTLCRTTGNTGFMHEAFFKDDASKFTRSWFAWANGLFGELVLKLRRERPALLRDFRIAVA